MLEVGCVMVAGGQENDIGDTAPAGLKAAQGCVLGIEKRAQLRDPCGIEKIRKHRGNHTAVFQGLP